MRRAAKTKIVVAGFIPAIVSLFASASPAFADLKICNRMSYVVEAAIGIDEKSATATRGWFRIDPAACRTVVQGTLSADRILLHARALPLYGASPIPQGGSDTLCVAKNNFVIAAARECRAGQTQAAFTQVTPGQLALSPPVGSPAYFPLNAGSAAVDAGTNAGCPAVDQRGVRRPIDGDRNGVAVCDVGAFELQDLIFLPVVRQ